MATAERVGERFVLARRGLPLLTGVAGATRGSAWLPAAARSRVSAVAPRPSTLPVLPDEPAAPTDDDDETQRSAHAGRAAGRSDEQPAAVVTEAAQRTALPADGAVAQDADGASRTDSAAWTPQSLPRSVPAGPRTPEAPHAAAHAPSVNAAAGGAGDPRAGAATPPREPVRRPMPAEHVAHAAQAPAHGAEDRQAASPAVPRQRSAAQTTAAAGPAVASAPPVQRSATMEPPAPARAQRAVDVDSVPAAFAKADRAGSDDHPHTPTARPTSAAPRPAAEPGAAPPRLMGMLPSRAATATAAASPDLGALLGPPAAAPRTVRIDRLDVSVRSQLQTPSPPARSATVAPAAAPAATGMGSGRSFRNPWAAYHTRRD